MAAKFRIQEKRRFFAVLHAGDTAPQLHLGELRVKN
jgi:hypothetical protein